MQVVLLPIIWPTALFSLVATCMLTYFFISLLSILGAGEGGGGEGLQYQESHGMLHIYHKNHFTVILCMKAGQTFSLSV